MDYCLNPQSRERKAHKMTDDEIDKHTNRKKREFKLDAELDRLNTQVDIKVNFSAQRRACTIDSSAYLSPLPRPPPPLCIGSPSWSSSDLKLY